MSDGAPTLLSGAAPAAPTPVTADAVSSDGSSQSDWGIYDAKTGEKVIDPDSIISIDYRREWTLADYQIEGGGFETYDKVARPFDVRVRVAKGGNESDRGDFMVAVEKMAGSLTLCNVVTPEVTYLSVNVASIANSRTASAGVGLITYDLELREVRVTAQASFINVGSQGAADPQSGGTVQPQPAPAPTQAEINAAVAEARAAIDANMFSTPAF